MAQKNFPGGKNGEKSRKRLCAYQKLLYKKALSRKKKRTRKNRIFNRKKRKTGKTKKQGIFTRKNLEIAGTICMLSLAVVVFGHAIRWNPFTRREPGTVQREISAGDDYQILPAEEGPCGRPETIQDFIVENPYSRSGIPLEQVNGIVVHYVANAGSTAEENRNYFENLKDTHLTKASSHFIIDWTERLSSAFLSMRFPTRPMRGIRIRFPLSAVTEKRMESLRKKRTVLW